MKKRLCDVFVYDEKYDLPVIVRSAVSEKEASKLVYDLEKLGVVAVYGFRPDRILDGKCVYDED